MQSEAAALSHSEIEAMFTRGDGRFVFARWGRPIAPVVFGVEAETLGVIKGAFEAVCMLAGHTMAETDPELGSNVMVFFCRDWQELTGVPDLDRLVPDLEARVAALQAQEANQYRLFRFDRAGAIQACFVFLRMDADLRAMSAEALALGQVVQLMLLWSEAAFAERSALAIAGDTLVLRPEIAELIRVAYDPVLPDVAEDASHALRLAARLSRAAST